MAEGFWIEQLDEMPGAECPCGTTRRAFVRPDNDVASLHLVDISADSQPHYHNRLTEIYLVLEGEGQIELDGVDYPVRPMTAVLIKPGTVHRAKGNLRIVNVPVPPFDPADEHFPER